MEKYLSVHVLLDLYGCALNLNNPEMIHSLMLEAAKKAKTTVLNSYVHQFAPQGVSCVVVISESHLSIHTWPEFGHAEVDVFTCGENALPSIAIDFLSRVFEPQRAVLYRKERGEVAIINSYENEQGKT
jgi:S-adenosylmethionine decarboxylase